MLVVDDQPEFLDLAREMLDGHPRLKIVSQATSGQEALALLPHLKANAVLIDVQMPGLNGFEVARRLADSRPDLVVLLMTGALEYDFEPLARDAGAIGCLNKRDLRPETVLALLDRHSPGTATGEIP